MRATEPTKARTAAEKCACCDQVWGVSLATEHGPLQLCYPCAAYAEGVRDKNPEAWQQILRRVFHDIKTSVCAPTAR